MNINRLTLYSHGAGCGCKIAPDVLSDILAQAPATMHFPSLLVGNMEKDDAAIMDLGDGTGLISTVDFFMPIVDDPYDFGRIAAVNALSDIYAMGGEPIIAIAILGWPVKDLGLDEAGKVMQGGRDVCNNAGIPLAGGHSIDSVEPFFGLSVNGRVALGNIKRNKGAVPGDLLYLSKPLGVGILTTAQKLERLLPQDIDLARDQMIIPNKIGSKLGTKPYVHAMTDITGFGLLGHLLELCEASGVGAELHFADIPIIGTDRLSYYLKMQCIPAATLRNWESMKGEISELPADQRALLCDPQTSGGLLVAVDPAFQNEFDSFAKTEEHANFTRIGCITDAQQKLIRIH